MKDKTFNFRCSDEFNQFVESAWRLDKYSDKGIKSKGDILRHMLFRGLEKDYKGILIKFKDVPEIKSYLEFKSPQKKPQKITNRFAEYMEKRSGGELKFENEESED